MDYMKLRLNRLNSDFSESQLVNFFKLSAFLIQRTEENNRKIIQFALLLELIF